MTPDFEKSYNDLLALFPPKSKKQAEVHRDDLWDVLKFDKHLVNEVFNRVRKEWGNVSLPPIRIFQDTLNEIRYGEKEKVRWHKTNENGDPHPDCKCEGCKQYNGAVEGKCLNIKCDRDRENGDGYCNRCHVIAKSYYCICDMCETHRKRLLEVEKADIEDDLPF